ncbi:hypothetical protein [Acinetobacter guillouiae]|uniref:hypothetical protein n=1 Tax=Acinetobacter guillouiae TaxID=106649 RepID=UPI0028D28C39|nr:hypothetical protein [Acinetobacter guillouiae]
MNKKIFIYFIVGLVLSFQANAEVNNICNWIAELAQKVMNNRVNGVSKSKMMEEIQNLRRASENSSDENNRRHLADQSGLTAMFTSEVYDIDVPEDKKLKKQAVKNYHDSVFKECIAANE